MAAGPRAIKVGKDARSQAILAILDEPINMPFANETPLEDVLKYIKQATTTEKHPGLPIYVDPVGLLEAERTTNSTVQIDLENVPLRASLRLRTQAARPGLQDRGRRLDHHLRRLGGSQPEDESAVEAAGGEPGRPGVAGMGGMMMGGMGGGAGMGRLGAAPKPQAPAVARGTGEEAEARRRPERRADARAAFVETAYWNPSVVTDATGRAAGEVPGTNRPRRVPPGRAGRDRLRHAGRAIDVGDLGAQGILRRVEGTERVDRGR